VRRTGARAALTVVVLDATTTRDEVAAFARAAGSPRARYVVDDRNGSVQSMLDSPGLASSLVYDARGRAVSRPDPASPRIAKALRRAGA